MDRHVEAFLEMLAAERGAARNTLAAYRADLTDFAAHVAGRGEAVSGASEATLQSYLRGLTEAGLSARTAARRLSCLRQFHRFLIGGQHRADDPTLRLDPPRQARSLPDCLTEAEVDALLAAARPHPLAHAAIEALYATGLRVSELLALPRRGAGRGWADAAGARQGRQAAAGAAVGYRARRRRRAGRRRQAVPLAVPRPGSEAAHDPAGLPRCC